MVPLCDSLAENPQPQSAAISRTRLTVNALGARFLRRMSLDVARLGVRQEAGKEQEVKVRHGEGLANHPDPE
jgi:hypothetical protein